MNTNPLLQVGHGDRVTQIGNLLFPPTGSRRGIRATQNQRIANPRHSRLPACATLVAALATVSMRG